MLEVGERPKQAGKGSLRTRASIYTEKAQAGVFIKSKMAAFHSGEPSSRALGLCTLTDEAHWDTS